VKHQEQRHGADTKAERKQASGHPTKNQKKSVVRAKAICSHHWHLPPRRPRPDPAQGRPGPILLLLLLRRVLVLVLVRHRRRRLLLLLLLRVWQSQRQSNGGGSSQHKTVFFGGWGPKDPLPPPYLQVSFTIALIREGFSGMVEWGALSTEGLL